MDVGFAADTAVWSGRRTEPHEADMAAPLLLLAGDNRIVCKLIIKVLESYQLRIRYVLRGDDAVDLLMAEKLDIALIDVNLPVMNGFEVVRHYRFAALGRKHLPILGLVGSGMTGQISACMDAGMDGCLQKPIDPAQLIEAIRSFIPLEASVRQRSSAEESSSWPQPEQAAEPVRPENPADVPAINMQVLKDLEQLGGRQFVEEIVSQFVSDANRIFPELAASIRAADVQASRDLLHALRSCAANVGARAIFELCLAWRAIDLDELVERGEILLQQLEDVFANARHSLREFESSKSVDLSDQWRAAS
jgi:two-component system sensor histidine kinase RpfC